MLDIIIVILLLVAAWMGYHRGLIGSLIGLFGNLIALAIAYLLAGSVAKLIDAQFGTIAYLTNKVQGILPLPSDLADVTTSMEGVGRLYTLLEQVRLPQALKDNLLQGMQDQASTIGAGAFETISYTMAHIIAQSVWHGIVFLLLWIVLGVVIVWGSQMLVGVVHHIPLIGTLDRAGGAVVSVVLVALTLTVIYSVAGMLGMWDSPFLAQSQILNAMYQGIQILWKQ